jgi:hypothetical protein
MNSQDLIGAKILGSKVIEVERGETNLDFETFDCLYVQLVDGRIMSIEGQRDTFDRDVVRVAALE